MIRSGESADLATKRGYLERQRDAFIGRFRAVSSDDAWTEWCRFFLDGVADERETMERKVRPALNERVKSAVVDLTQPQHGVRALGFNFRRPVFVSTQLVAQSGVPEPTALR